MRLLKQTLVCCCLAGLTAMTAACTRHEVDVKPVEIKPIHITIDINVKVDRALDDFFGDLDEVQAD
ncbi:MAG: hypothetical protein V2I36_02020 [Desulfopila sp.]|nr:hypothetical protein [Desulfopila sp.]